MQNLSTFKGGCDNLPQNNKIVNSDFGKSFLASNGSMKAICSLEAL